jgi:hypothetical protein
MNDLAQALKDTTSIFPDPSLQINFLANHDLPRFRSVVAADSIAFNAVVAQFLFPGFPVTYYGQYLRCYRSLGTVLLISELRVVLRKVKSRKSLQASQIPTTDKLSGAQEWVDTLLRPIHTRESGT